MSTEHRSGPATLAARAYRHAVLRFDAFDLVAVSTVVLWLPPAVIA